MEIDEDTLAGARELASYWPRRLCDRRGSCSHDHKSAPAGVQRSDPFADLRLLDSLERIEKNDFAPAASPAPVSARSGEARQDDDGDERGKRIMLLLRFCWERHARRLGVLEDAGEGIYRGEESAASLGESAT